jgi:putative sigma-54 modulation protein
MDVDVRIHCADLAAALCNYVDRRLRFSLGRFGGRLGQVKVRITDLNGPRGGADKSCRISAELLPSGKLIWQEAVDPNLFVAIDHATERIGRTFARELERLLDLRYQRESVRTG